MNMFIEKRTPVQGTAWQDYAYLEMTCIPIPHESKRPDYRWLRMQWTKLHVLMDDDKGMDTLATMYGLADGGLAVVCGYPSENLMVIDCDTMAKLEECRRQLRARGIDAPCAYSARGGHLYMRIREGAVQTIAAGVMQDVEVRGDGAIVVLPPTRHPSGVYYRWQTGHPPRNIPTISKNEIDFLVGVDGQPLKLALARKRVRRLADETRDYLARGHLLAEGTRNARLHKAARDYKYIGKDEGAALHDLLPIAVKSGLSEKEATGTIRSPFKRKSKSSKKTFNQTDELLAFAMGIVWEGRTGKTDRRIFEALIERRGADYERADGVFRASLREIASIARFDSIGTVSRALHRLLDAGYIEYRGRDKNSSANLYRISDMALGAGQFFLMHNKNIKQQLSVRSTYCVLFAQLQEKSALGINGMNILQYLREQRWAITAQEITDAMVSYKSHSTTTRHLSNLIKWGLVEQVERYSYRAIDVSAADERALVVDSGAYAAAKAREARFMRDRAMFAANSIIKFYWFKNREGQSS